MKHDILKKISAIIGSAIFIAGAFLLSPENSFAKPNNEFSRTYNLIVHNNNRDSFVPRIKALEVLIKYYSEYTSQYKKNPEISFKDVPQFNSIKKACAIKLFDCSEKNFNPDKPISQRDFLNWFFKLKHFKEPDLLDKKYPLLKESHLRDWVEARRLNLLTGNQITYNIFQEFLYRNSVSELNLNQPFSEGLTIQNEDITAKNYHNLKEIKLIQNNLVAIIKNLENSKKLTSEEKDYMERAKKNLRAFEDMEKTLYEKPYSLRQRPDLNTEVAKAVSKYNLQEVLFSYSYDYSKNAGYRKHNLIQGVQKMNGKIFMPGGDIDYWKSISDKGLSEFVYGWVISGGREEWEFGGGICGSSSIVFLPAWKAGLEILERKNHSKFYANLYPIEYIGLDATVYRPKPNLRIRNNTEHPIVFNVENDKEKEVITIEIIGNKPYKNIRIEGPIFLTKYHVKWIRHYEDFDGKITSDTLESRYSAIY